ncbi:MAG: glycosyltransferase [Solirubrobacteraceae bacterium]
MSPRPDISFIAWVREDSRSRSLATGLGGEAQTFFDLRIHSRPLVPLRYLISAVRTVLYLARRRPRAVAIQSPPQPAAALVWLWARLARIPLVLDTHPSNFETSGIHHRMQPLLRALVPGAACCIVTTDRLGDEIRSWGGRPVVVHEAPMPWSSRAQPRPHGPARRVLFVCTFAPDEPLAAVLGAAARLPETEFQITGDLRRLAADVREQAPPNVTWMGYLGLEDYVAALAGADVVLSVSERVESVPRSAYEAVDALRPVVLTDRDHMRPLFPDAVWVDNDPESIASGVTDALTRCDELGDRALEARVLQGQRWELQLAELRALIEAGPRRRRH